MRVVVFYLIGIWMGVGIFLLQDSKALSQEATVHAASIPAKATSPLQQPQLSLLGGNGMNGKFYYRNSDAHIKGEVKNTEIREVDLEIYGGRGFNIGVDGRFENGKAKFTEIKTIDGKKITDDLDSFVFRTTIGTFIRGQYLITPRLGVFARGEIAFGPYIEGLAGIAFDGIAQVGFDFYFSEWWGITAGYGYMGSVGIETIASQEASLRKYFGKTPMLYTSGSNLLLIGLKSTYL